jgi:hypothetical protein
MFQGGTVRTKTLFAAALISVLAATVASAQRGRGRGGFGQDPGRENREVADFNPVRLMDPLEPIVDAPVIQANEVTDQVLPEELVLGVVIAGMPRAYPLNMLT